MNETALKPAHHGKSPISGCEPPAAYRWQKGVSGNPAGRPAAGAVLREWIDQMASWTRAELRRAFEDPESPAAKVEAAHVHLCATTDKVSKAGVPISTTSLDQIFDRTTGRPSQSFFIATDHDHTTETESELRAMGAEKLQELLDASTFVPALPLPVNPAKTPGKEPNVQF